MSQVSGAEPPATPRRNRGALSSSLGDSLGDSLGSSLAESLAESLTETITETLSGPLETLAEIKPRLRGWLHAGIVPVTLVGGVLLVALSPAGAPRVGSIVFALSALVLFTVSATMHRGRWSARTNLWLTRADHACIFLLIAGTCTPFALLLLEGTDRVVLLSVAWGGAVVGATFRLLRPGAPRWVYTPIYLALGWVAVFFAPDFARHTGVVVMVLIASGGVFYTLGGVVYGLRRPNPFPSWFGFHEVFHALTILAFAAHYAGILVATYTLR